MMYEKVLCENPMYNKKEPIKKLEDAFEVSKIIFISSEKSDFTGHADCMVSFVKN